MDVTSGHTYDNIHIHGGRVVVGNQYSIELRDRRILQWLSPLNPWEKHKEAREKYRQGTLDWFFDHAELSKWFNGEFRVSWCPGSMGTGKTILMSAILAHLLGHFFVEPSVGTAFFYCQYQARDEQTLSNILGCLLLKLYFRTSDEATIPDAVCEVYNRRTRLSPKVSQLRDWWAKKSSEGRGP